MASILGIADSDLQSLGSDETIEGVLQNFGNEVQEELRESLVSKDMQVSDKLGSSIIYDINEDAGVISFELKMEKYGDFLDEGVTGIGGNKQDGQPWTLKQSTGRFSFKEGKKPPIFKEWADAKGISPFAARESVFRGGIKQTNWYSEVMEGKVEELKARLAKAGAKEIQVSFKGGKLKGTTK